MKRSIWILAALAVTALTFNATAGEGHHKKCTEGTEACLTKMVSNAKSKGYLGIETEKNDYGRYVITEVTAGSPAAAAGFQAGDVLLAVNGVEISADNKKAMKKAKASLTPGAKASYVVKRAGGKQKVAAKLGHVPEDLIAEWIGRHMIEHHAHSEIASK